MSTILLFSAGIINFILGCSALLKNYKKTVNQSFFVTTLCFALWCISLAVFNNAITIDQKLFWGRMIFVGPHLFPSALLFFSYHFPTKQNFPNLLKFFVLTIGLFFLIAIPFTVTGIASDGTREFGFVNKIYPFYFLVFIVWSLTRLIKSYREGSGVTKSQLLLVFFGLSSTLAISSITNLLLPLAFNSIDYNWTGPLATVLFIGSTTFAIFRYRLFNFQIQLQKTVNTLIPIILSTLLTLFLAYALYQFIEWGGERNGILLLIFYTFSYKFFNYLFTKTKLSYLLFRKTYRFHQSLVELANRASDITHFDALVKELQQTFLNSGFIHAFAFFVITDQDKQSCHVYETHNINPAELAICAESVLHPFLHHELTLTREPLVIDELVYSTKPELKELKKAFHPLQGGVCIPLFVSNDLAGLILLGPKEHNGAYTTEDIKIFKQISTALAVAVTKALLFTHYQDRVVELSRDKRNLEESISELKRMKNEFLTIVDHQFNTPLSIIESAFAMIQEGDVPLEEIQEYVTSMAPRMQEFKQIVNDMLRAAHFEGTGTDLKFSLVSVIDSISNLIPQIQPLIAQHDVSLTAKLPDQLPRVTTDPEQFSVALGHILRNAIIYGQNHPVKISAELTKGQKVRITITDHGRGFNHEESLHIGEKFFRGKNTVDFLANGSGLGLFIAKKIIESSGGTISWHSDGPGKGAIFVVELPKAAEFVKTMPVMPE